VGHGADDLLVSHGHHAQLNGFNLSDDSDYNSDHKPERKMKHIHTFSKLAAVLATALISPIFFASQAGAASTPFPMASGNYSENFSDMVSWPAGLGGTSTTASNWVPVVVGGTGTIPNGTKITVSTATFTTGTSGGLQTNSPIGSLTLLATGGTDNSTALAVDLLLDFTGRNAGTLGFSWAEVDNSTGSSREASLKVYTSIDNSTWTELSGAFLTVTDLVAASGTISSLSLPASFSGSSTARIRFYVYNGGPVATGSGSRPKIAIDNVVVTSTGATGTPPTITGITPPSIAANAGDTAAFTVTATGDAANYYWYKATATSTNLIPGAATATLTLANVVATNAAGYFVVLSNATPPMATSSVVTLTVVDPYLAVQPINETRLVGVPTTFSVNVLGTQPLGYRWYVKPTADADFTGMTPLNNGGTLAGAASNVLSIASVAYSDATNYFVIATNSSGSVTSSVVTLTVANTAALAFWNFNGVLNITNPLVTQGVGTATYMNSTTFSNGPNYASANDYGGGSPNNAWGTSSYPTNGNAANNKTGGVRFNVSTLGAKNIAVTYDTKASSTASKYTRLQYTTNGTDFVDYPTSSSFASLNYESRAFSLAGFPGVANNTNFAIRVVSEYESTAKYGATNDAQYVGDGGTYTASSGTLTYDIVNISGDAITNNNTPPTISSFTNVVTTDLSGATVLNFTVGDAESAVGDLLVSARSFNQTVMPDGNLVQGGSGASLTLSLTPTPGALGVAPVQVTVTDTNGDLTTTWFYVTVNAGNQPPTITGLVNTNMLGNLTNIFAFTIGDDQTPATNLTLSVLSGNSMLVANDTNHLSFGGTSSNRTLVVVPVANQYGVAPITVTVSDGVNNTPVAFILVVRPNTVTALNEGFDYDASGAIISVSDGFWQTHSGTSGQMQVGSGVVTVTDGNSEDVNAPLIGQPYSATNKQVLYSSFTLNYSSLPTEGGTYFAHFKDATTSGFYGRVYASTLNAATGTYRLGIGNVTATNTTAQIAQDLVLNSNYTVVTRLVLTNGVSTVWINPTSESSPSMTDTTSVSTPSAITSYALRENAGEGTMNVDNLKVALNFLSVLTNIVDVPPQANGDAYSLTENSGTNSFNPLVNDVLNLPQGALSLVSVSPTNGTATISGTNVLFKPATNFVGTASIGYTITDGFGGTSSALIAVAVTNIPPVANPDAVTVAKNSITNQFTPLTNDAVNTPGGSLSIVSASSPNGTTTITNGGQQILFTPTTGFIGGTTIAYTITDNIGGTNSSTITVTVVDMSPPLVNAQYSGGNLILSWGNPALYLQSSTNVAGPYVNIPGATSPFTNDTVTVPTLFFRLTSQGPPTN
jgi:hypothetical protein